MKTRAFRILPVLLAAFVLAACKGAATDSADAESATATIHEQDKVRIPEKSPLRKALRMEPAMHLTIEQLLTAPAVVEADPARVMKVLTPVAGRVVKLEKVLGDKVATGDALVTLDSGDFATAQSDAAKARAALALTRANVERLRKLVAEDLASRRDFEQAESDFAAASAEEQRAASRLAGLGVAPGDAPGRLYTLRSPIAGAVVDLAAAQGGYWNDTTAALMTVADLSTVWVTASVQEKDIAQVFANQGANVTLNAYPDKPITGRVRDVGRILDPDTRTLKVRILVDNANGMLRPNMFARVVLHGDAHVAVVVPATALVQSGFKTLVYVETAPWTFEAREVKAGPVLEGRAEVMTGLQPGDRVVVKDGVLLRD
jgi:cobalt-zinc-cadmium efflux system membrane fusion protein